MAVKKETEVPKKTAEVQVKAENVKVPVKESVVKEEAVKAEKAPVKKAAAPKKTVTKTATPKTAKTASTQKETVSQNVYIQFAGKEIRTEALVEQVTKAWVEEGHRASSLKNLDLYVKPEESAAYYVVNGKETGKIEL